MQRPVHPHFEQLLRHKEQALIELYHDLRNFILEQNTQCHELLYHTHALTSVYSVSPKLGDAFCMIPIYTGHLNLGFNKGTLLDDPQALLQGTGKLIRHIPVNQPADYRNAAVTQLLEKAHELALEDAGTLKAHQELTHSKIKQ